MGGEAVVNGANVADFDAAGVKMIQQAIDTFGSCDILINNAGILRDQIEPMSEDDWDSVINAHLKNFRPYSSCSGLLAREKSWR